MFRIIREICRGTRPASTLLFGLVLAAGCERASTDEDTATSECKSNKDCDDGEVCDAKRKCAPDPDQDDDSNDGADAGEPLVAGRALDGTWEGVTVTQYGKKKQLAAELGADGEILLTPEAVAALDDDTLYVIEVTAADGTRQRVLVTGKELKEGIANVSYLTELVAQYVEEGEPKGAKAALRQRDELVEELISTDVNDDGVVDYEDVLAFEPDEDEKNLTFADLLGETVTVNGTEKTLAEALKDGDADEIREAVDQALLEQNGDDNDDDDQDEDDDDSDDDDNDDDDQDEDDNCPGVDNDDQLDTDEDGLGDACDSDADNDRIDNDVDNCPTVYNADQHDADEDGLGDLCDQDIDGDGLDNEDDNCSQVANEDQKDTDGDGLGDACTVDLDGDGVRNQWDNCLETPNEDQRDGDQDGIGNACDPDLDNDGIENPDDNCPETANEEQLDNDEDGLGDECDSDTDGDGIDDRVDNCVFTANEEQRDLDRDGVGDACESDRDSDGVPNEEDNCPDHPNSGQLDLDEDGVGDTCDPDRDDDGVDDADDNCLYEVNPDQADIDGDGVGDVCDASTEATVPPAVTDPNVVVTCTTACRSSTVEVCDSPSVFMSACHIDNPDVCYSLDPVTSGSSGGNTYLVALNPDGTEDVIENIVCIETEATRELPVDLVFVIDTTGSMGSAINGVKASIDAFVAVLASSDIDVRVGGIAYGDQAPLLSCIAPDAPYQTLTATFGAGTETDPTSFNYWLTNVSTSHCGDGGGDGPENALDAVETVIGNYPTDGSAPVFEFRPEALRAMVLLTDINAHTLGDGTSFAHYTLDTVLEDLKSFGAVHVVGPNTGCFTVPAGRCACNVTPNVCDTGCSCDMRCPSADCPEDVLIGSCDVAGSTCDIDCVGYRGSTCDVLVGRCDPSTDDPTLPCADDIDCVGYPLNGASTRRCEPTNQAPYAAAGDLALATGGTFTPLPSGGNVDLTALPISDTLAATTQCDTQFSPELEQLRCVYREGDLAGEAVVSVRR